MLFRDWAIRISYHLPQLLVGRLSNRLEILLPHVLAIHRIEKGVGVLPLSSGGQRLCTPAHSGNAILTAKWLPEPLETVDRVP